MITTHEIAVLKTGIIVKVTVDTVDKKQTELEDKVLDHKTLYQHLHSDLYLTSNSLGTSSIIIPSDLSWF